MLLLLGVPERAVVGVMGWSSSAMALRDQHLTGAVRSDIAARVDALLWLPQRTPANKTQTTPGPTHT